jgi:hypothetical protein
VTVQVKLIFLTTFTSAWNKAPFALPTEQQMQGNNPKSDDSWPVLHPSDT